MRETPTEYFKIKKRELLCNTSEISGKSLEIANLNEFSSSRNGRRRWNEKQMSKVDHLISWSWLKIQIKSRELFVICGICGGEDVGKCHGVPRDAVRSGNQSAHVSGSTACNRPGAMTNILKD
jgi:hypothetical protein